MSPECIVEWEKAGVVVRKLDGRDLLRNHVKSRAWVVDHSGLQVVVSCVISIKHSVCDIRHIISGIKSVVNHFCFNLKETVPCVGLASNENFSPLQGKSIYEVLPEAKELSCDIRLTSSCGCPLSKACPNRLLDPNHIGKI